MPIVLPSGFFLLCNKCRPAKEYIRRLGRTELYRKALVGDIFYPKITIYEILRSNSNDWIAATP